MGVKLFVPMMAIFAVAPAICQTQLSLPSQCREILDTALKDKNPDTRKMAVQALSLAGTGEPFATWLEGALEDKDVEVRLAAVQSLADLKSRRGIAALHKALKDDVPEVGFAAAKSLWALNDPAGKEALLAVLGGEMKTSSNFITKERRDTLRLLHTPRPMIFMALKQGIGFVPVPGLGEGISSMQGLLSDPGVSGRAAAALLLERDRSAATEIALKDALSDRDWSVRAAAVHALALRNDPAVERDLLPLLDDKKQAVRLRVAAAYSRLELIKHRGRARPAKKSD